MTKPNNHRTALSHDPATVAGIAGKLTRARVYQIGNELFRDLRAFLDCAGIDPSVCSLTITFPSPKERSILVDELRRSAPPMPTMSRPSSAQAGNYGGKWQGVEYLFAVRTHLERTSHDPD